MKKKYVEVLIAMCGCVGASYGITLNTAGVFYTAVADDLMIGRGAVSMMSTIIMFTAALSSMIIEPFLRKHNVRTLILIAAIMLTGGTALMSMAHDIAGLYLLSCVRGIGTGLLSVVTATFVLNAWFHKNIGLFTSLVFAFTGLPGVFLSPLFSYMIETGGWRAGYIGTAAVILIFLLPALVSRYGMDPSEYRLRPYGENVTCNETNDKRDSIIETDKGFSFHSVSFILVLLYSIGACGVAALLQHEPGYAESLGLDASVGALMVSFTNAANITGKLFSGALIDRIGTKRVIILLAGISLAGILLMLGVHTGWAMLAGAFLYGITFSNSSTGLAMITRDACGPENYDHAYPVINFVSTASNALSISLLGFLYDTLRNYASLFLLSACVQVMVIILTWIVYRRK